MNNKYNIGIPENWKRVWTVAEMEAMERAKNDPELDEMIDGLISILTGNSELLKVTLEWDHDTDNPDGTFFEDGVDIYVEAWIFDDIANQVRRVCARLSDLNEIANDYDRIHCGWQTRFEMK